MSLMELSDCLYKAIGVAVAVGVANLIQSKPFAKYNTIILGFKTFDDLDI